ncbi:BrnA antitoxin family protein [Amylibacter sp. IMCC11727]|uniref:BrnA antitoxin family protein n=1 Tax=Amylibacter sp. IMCC11727 TaxID=3039851 RepID=UPI00244E1F3E|nr:BrnA antitoxin family protein [Amylibacter sp. IMCC11727]WGI23413.1 BrnA antitoxin family protein [Amylibacter sp. IMCC11727]
MVTKAQETARADLVAELKTLQESFYDDWMTGSLPEIWNEIPQLHPMRPNKVKVTLSLDEDMIKWFRKLGRGYQARINSILRVYWQALLSGQIKAHWDAEAIAPKEHSLLERLLKEKIKEVRARKIKGVSEADLNAMEQELTESLRMVRAVHGGAKG